MTHFNESELEAAAIEWFQELGYGYAFGPDLLEGGERENYDDVVLRGRLLDALKRINIGVSANALNDAMRQIVIGQTPDLLKNNRAFHKFIVEGVSVAEKQSDGSYRNIPVKIFDSQNINKNDFLVVNQFTIRQHGVEKRPDLVVFLNGLPVVVAELKDPSNANVDISQAFNQIQTYKDAISSLFLHNAFCLISDGINAKVGTLTSDEDRFMHWRTIDGNSLASVSVPQLEVVIKGMFEKFRFLDIIKNFILFQEGKGEPVKILAGYHQYHAVNKALESTKAATKGDHRAGVIWHTQGSGKSLTMVFYTAKLVGSQDLENPTIVVITDRNDLDDQLFCTFQKSAQFLRNTPVQAESREHLHELLNGRESGGVIFTTIHKFAPEDRSQKVEPLTTRKNVIVIADEAHRSQYGFGVEVVSDGKNDAEVKFGLARYMRESLPNASYIGFTGTPIESSDKSTRAVFGDYIDVYDMTRAVDDGTTVRIYYESRIAQLKIPDELKPKIDIEYDEITESEEVSAKEKLKSKWARLEAIVGAKERVALVAKDIVEHFEKREAAQENTGGKAMIVAMSRRIAIDLYNEIIALRPDWHSDDLAKGKIKIVMTGSSSDPAEWQKHIGTKATRETLAARIKKLDDELKIVIVRDMWLTGFDVPSMHTMYIDKPMQGHNLMQAIARVNRVFKNKQGGLVVDYIGIAENLKLALADYTETDKNQAGVDTSVAENLMLEKLDIIREMLHGCDYSEFFTTESSKIRMQTIASVMDFIISQREERKSDYIKLVAELRKAFSLCATTQKAQSLALEVGFHKSVQIALQKLMLDGKKQKTGTQLDAELNQLISRSITSDEVIDILQYAGLSHPDISILSDEFLEEVKGMKKKNLAIALLNKLLAGKVKAFSRRNLVQSKKFSELLEASIKKYQNRTIETTQVILELIDLAKQINDAQTRGEKSDLSEDELAFYDALAKNDSAKTILGDDILKKIAQDLTKAIKNDLTVDWSIRENVRAKMKMTVKKLLKKYGYPPDQTPEAVELVLEQTRLMCEANV